MHRGLHLREGVRRARMHASLYRPNSRSRSPVVQHGRLRQSSKTGRPPEALTKIREAEEIDSEPLGVLRDQELLRVEAHVAHRLGECSIGLAGGLMYRSNVAITAVTIWRPSILR